MFKALTINRYNYQRLDLELLGMPLFLKQMEADFGDIEMQLTAYRDVVLEEHIAKD